MLATKNSEVCSIVLISPDAPSLTGKRFLGSRPEQPTWPHRRNQKRAGRHLARPSRQRQGFAQRSRAQGHVRDAAVCRRSSAGRVSSKVVLTTCSVVPMDFATSLFLSPWATSSITRCSRLFGTKYHQRSDQLRDCRQRLSTRNARSSWLPNTVAGVVRKGY
jgi:hypothetical protein